MVQTGAGTPGAPGENTSSQVVGLGSRTRSSNPSATGGQDEQEDSEEAGLFAALEQLERQMSAGMTRAGIRLSRLSIRLGRAHPARGA